MDLSVIVSAYNLGENILPCLKSLHNQNIENTEYLIVDDGSIDDTEYIIKNYIQSIKDKRFLYLKKENGGISDARNFGINNARGKYLFFIDGDDYIEPNVLNKLLLEIKKQNVEMLDFGFKVKNKGCVRIPYKEKYNSILNGIDAFNKIYFDEGNFWANVWHFIIKKEFIIKNNLFFKKGIYIEDLLWTINCVLYAKEYYHDGSIIAYNYIVRDNTITTDDSKASKRIKDHFYVLEKLKKEINQKNVLNKNIIQNFLVKTYIREAIIANTKDVKINLKEIKLFMNNMPLDKKDKLKLIVLNLPSIFRKKICKWIYINKIKL